MSEANLKKDVQAYWDHQPCGTQFTDTPWGSREFFDEVDRVRYERQPFMRNAVGFDRYPGKSLLEIGCGLGTDLVRFARGGARVTGIDLTPESIRLARRRFELEAIPARFLVGDAENLPFPSSSIDVVYSFGVLHHTPDPPKAFRELRRVLRPGGEAVVMLYHSRSTHLYLGYPVAMLARLRRGLPLLGKQDYFRVYDGENNPLGKAYTRGEVRRLFSGFEILEQKTYDTWRPRLPGVVNRLLLLLGRRFGFYLVTRARRPVEA
jgi:ubiquinone/menaquinone biosynthesis C-methylase UbiE